MAAGEQRTQLHAPSAESMAGIETEALVARKGDGSLEVETILLSEPAADEVLVRIISSSICRADVHSAHNDFFIKVPMIPGHEAAGVVVRVGDAAKARIRVGQHVILSFGYCMSCRFCSSGRSAICPHLPRYNFSGKRLDGTPVITTATTERDPINGLFFAQSSWSRMALAHMSCVVPVDLSLEELKWAGAFSCGNVTGAGTILNVCKPPPNSHIAIWGVGGVGLAAVMAANLSTPATLIAIDTVQSRLDMALSLGATHAFLASDDALTRIKEATKGDMLDFALDCVGHQSIAGLAHRCLANGGMVVQVGSAKIDATPDINMVEHLVTSKSWVGSHQGNSHPQTTIPLLISLWRAGKFPIETLLKTYAWRDVATAIADMESGKTIKPVLLFDD